MCTGAMRARVRGLIMGSQNYGNVGESQPVHIVNDASTGTQQRRTCRGTPMQLPSTQQSM
eukprot:COSAG01_NODE_1885_length_8988_cov_2.861514_6_plen_60_part_00